MFNSTIKIPKRLPYKPISPDYYNEEYYSGKKSAWDEPYNYDTRAKNMSDWAKSITQAFPYAKSILDVGCAIGLLEYFVEKINQKHKWNDRIIEGIDISEWAIQNAVPGVNVSQASVDDYQFKRNFDLMVILDVMEHLTDEQAFNFLKRSRSFINDSVMAFIALDEARNRAEPSHITLKKYDWWDQLFLDAGWVKTPSTKAQLDGAKSQFAFRHKANQFFIYRARKGID